MLGGTQVLVSLFSFCSSGDSVKLVRATSQLHTHKSAIFSSPFLRDLTEEMGPFLPLTACTSRMFLLLSLLILTLQMEDRGSGDSPEDTQL